MSNYYGSARSNYIRWNQTKMNALSILFSIETTPRTEKGYRAILSTDEGGTPTQVFYDLDPNNEDDRQVDALIELGLLPSREDMRANTLLGIFTDLPEELDFLDVVHLAFAEDPGGLFVWFETGHQKSIYINASATAIDATGEVIHRISLDDIYDLPDVNSRAEN